MSLIRWQDSFSIGVSFIDADHQVIISLLNQLAESCEKDPDDDVVGSVLNVLVQYSVNHFHREERLMEVIGYPQFGRHEELHSRFAERIGLLQRRYDAGAHAAVDELLELLKNWLVDHIIGEDIRLLPWVERAQLTPDDLTAIARHPLLHEV